MDHVTIAVVTLLDFKHFPVLQMSKMITSNILNDSV